MRSKLMMLKSKVKPQMNADEHRFRSAGIAVYVALSLVLMSGCRYDMQDQPKMKPFRGTSFFGDGLSSRQPIEGTVARGFLRTDKEFYTGKKSSASASATPGATQPQPNQGAQANTSGQANVAGQTNNFPDDV